MLRPARPERRRQDHYVAVLPGPHRADGGSIRIGELQIPRHARTARARVGGVAQFDNLDVHFTVAENLIVYGRYFGLTPRECRALVPRLLEFGGLAEKADAKIETLSGGMKRRLMIARALVGSCNWTGPLTDRSGSDKQGARE